MTFDELISKFELLEFIIDGILLQITIYTSSIVINGGIVKAIIKEAGMKINYSPKFNTIKLVNIIHKKFLEILMIFSIIFYKKYDSSLLFTTDLIAEDKISYPRIFIEDFLLLSKRENKLYDNLPVVSTNENGDIYKEFYLTLSDNSPSKIKDILLRIGEDDKFLYMSCSNYFKFGGINDIELYEHPIDYSYTVNRVFYDKGCNHLRKLTNPLQSGKDVLKFLYFLSYNLHIGKVTRTDASHIPNCEAPFIIVRLSLGLDALGVNDNFYITDQYEKEFYDQAKEVLQSDSELVAKSEDFMVNKHNRELQPEICKDIKIIVESRYKNLSRKLSTIKFQRLITEKDSLNWLNEWEPYLKI